MPPHSLIIKIMLLQYVFHFIFFNVVHAQYDNDALKEIIPVDTSDAGWVKLRLSNDNFLKNNEYFNKQMT
ncbi:MAG: hypothetical protein ABIQ74_11795, partial [Chitinophagales bacterium]